MIAPRYYATCRVTRFVTHAPLRYMIAGYACCAVTAAPGLFAHVILFHATAVLQLYVFCTQFSVYIFCSPCHPFYSDFAVRGSLVTRYFCCVHARLCRSVGSPPVLRFIVVYCCSVLMRVCSCTFFSVLLVYFAVGLYLVLYGFYLFYMIFACLLPLFRI